MFIDWIIRIARGAPDKLRPATKSAYRVGFEQLEARMVMSADFGHVAGDMAMETLSYSEPSLDIGDVSSIESSGMYDFMPDLDSLRNPQEYGSDNILHNTALTYQALDGQAMEGREYDPYAPIQSPFDSIAIEPESDTNFPSLFFDIESDWLVTNSFAEHGELILFSRSAEAQPASQYQQFNLELSSGVIVGNGDFFISEFDSLLDPWDYGTVSISFETTLTYQTFVGLNDEFLAESMGLVSLVSPSNTAQLSAAIAFMENANDRYVIEALPQPTTLHVGSDKMAYQVNPSDSNEFNFGTFERFSPAGRPLPALELGASRLKQSVGVDDIRNSQSLGIDDDFADLNRSARFDIGQQADAGRTSMHKEVEDLLRRLHSPPSRSVEATEKHAIDSDAHISPAIRDSHEGGMVLLRAAEYSHGNELFLVDEAYAQLGDLFDIRVRMIPAMGAYQAFDDGSRIGPSEHIRSPSVSSEDFNDNDNSLEDEKIGSHTTSNASLSPRTGSDVLTTGVIAACCAAVSRYWRRRR